MNFKTIYDVCQRAFLNINIAYLICGCLAIIVIAMLAQFIRYAALYRNARLFSKTKRFVKKNGNICQSNFANYFKKVKALLSHKEKDFVKSCRGIGTGYCGSYVRERVNNAVIAQKKASHLFRNFAIFYIFVLHAILVCFGMPWLAVYMIVAVVAISLFAITKIFAIIRRIWTYFDDKKGYKLDELLCQSIGKNTLKNSVGAFENLPQQYDFKKSYTPDTTLDRLCSGINSFLAESPNPQIARVIGQNLTEIKNCGYLNSSEEKKLKNSEDSLNNYCS